MKIATFNINNVNRRLPNLLGWLKAAKPDIVCLQELKCTDAEFPVEAIKRAGYHAVWRGQRTWNGVAILSRRAEPIVTRSALPGDPTDAQAPSASRCGTPSRYFPSLACDHQLRLRGMILRR